MMVETDGGILTNVAYHFLFSVLCAAKQNLCESAAFMTLFERSDRKCKELLILC